MDGAAPLVFLLFVVFAAGMLMWYYARADRILEQWANDNGYEIMSKERRWFRRGPFFWWTARGQEVYYVSIRTSDGHVKRGWVRCGSWLFGVFQNQAEVRWDE